MSKNLSSQSAHEWMVVYTTNNLSEAHIVAGRLRHEGVDAMVHQEPLGGALGITVGALGEVKVLVGAEDYERAQAVLNDEIPPELPDDVDRIVFGDLEDDEREDN
jgi:hypothetical protein